jgi:Sec-independent protein translocase protein TatA
MTKGKAKPVAAMGGTTGSAAGKTRKACKETESTVESQDSDEGEDVVESEEKKIKTEDDEDVD